jgi:alpha-beta hydrolase superfamily lysophospholipase
MRLNVNTQFVEMSDGAKLALHEWKSTDTVKAIIFICHGMVEYAKRYDKTAEAFVQKGYTVFAHDLRGHGETAGTLNNAGYLAPGDGFERSVLDLREIILHIKKEFPEKKIVLLGHSFGSFLAQGYIERFAADIDACILSGTAGPRVAFMSLALIIIKIVAVFKGEKHRSPFLLKITFGAYNKRIKNPVSFYDWLSRDSELVKQHDADPWCTFLSTVAFSRDLASGLVRIHKKSAMALIPRALAVLIFSGGADPVGDYGKSVSDLAARYRANGMADVTLILYPEGRHEMLNEINKAEVIADVAAWIDARV